MASASSMSMPTVTSVIPKVLNKKPSLPLIRASSKQNQQLPTRGQRLQVQASNSFKEKAVTGLTAAVLTASMVVPQVAEAAGSGVSPSLKNFLLSIIAGGVVLAVIGGAVIGVAYFDPVKRT